VKSEFPKRERKRLSREPYQQLHQEILRLDGWHCQLCGSDKICTSTTCRPEGDDREQNLITLWGDCLSV